MFRNSKVEWMSKSCSIVLSRALKRDTKQFMSSCELFRIRMLLVASSSMNYRGDDEVSHNIELQKSVLVSSYSIKSMKEVMLLVSSSCSLESESVD